jgi:hypothetical protein
MVGFIEKEIAVISFYLGKGENVLYLLLEMLRTQLLYL